MQCISCCYAGSIIVPSGIKKEEAQYLLSYRQSILKLNVPCSPSVLSEIWRHSDRHISCDFYFPQVTSIISEEMKSSHAFRMNCVLDQTPWKNAITKREFEQWILPYRAANEMIDFTGDSLLRIEYSPLIESVNDPVEAFRIISKKVFDTMRECNSACPYTLDAYTINYIRQANCEQRCVLLVHILRQLGIPCCIDRIPFWGNYSTVGHSWVVMPYKGKIFIFEDTSKGGIIHESTDGYIDAAVFQVKYMPTSKDCFPYPIHSKKEITKVYRLCNNNDQVKDSLFAYSEYEDVSHFYGLTHGIKKQIDKTIISDSVCYLCAFRTGSNWEPIDRTIIDKFGFVYFKNTNPRIIYILAQYKNGKLQPLTNPFLGKSPNQEFTADIRQERIVLHRKYPIFSHWTNQWGNMVNSTFEAANDESFSTCDTIAVVSSMPYGYVSESATAMKSYRYVRYHAGANTRTPLAELELFSNGSKLTGRPISSGVLPGKENAAFDGNPNSVCSTKQTGYWIGLDLSRPCFIDSICYLPKNDGNDIQVGHRYELYYFNKGWKSLGSKVAMSRELKYYVPIGALLLLKDKTAGREERVFLYDQTKKIQIWY